MSDLTNAIALQPPLFPRLDAEKLKEVEGYSELNEKLLEAMYGDAEDQTLLDQYMPNHFGNLNKALQGIHRILMNSLCIAFKFKSEKTHGAVYPLIDLNVTAFEISNPMNYGDGNFNLHEASLIYAMMSYGYLCEISEGEEQEFAYFMIYYIKELISAAYDLHKNNPDYNFSGIYQVTN
jgi:hypothetical protein